MQELLILLKIIQVVSNEQRHKDGLKRLGKGYFKAYRLNPYHPISYFVWLLYIPIYILIHGVAGFIDAYENPFRWS